MAARNAIDVKAPFRYAGAPALFKARLDASLYNNAPAVIVINAKEHCRAKPVCEACPFAALCVYSDANQKSQESTIHVCLRAIPSRRPLRISTVFNHK
jgi:hypothetical protein